MISTNYVNVFKKDSLSTLRVDPTKTIFISGAGISQDHPSNLPVGNKLTKWYIDTMLGYCANNFLEFWNLHFPPIAKSVHEDGSVSIPKDPIRPKNLETPRLEFIIGEMDKMDRCLNAAGFHKSENKDRYRRKSSLKLLEYFQDAEPNDVHHRLAQFLKAGSEMITANFDVCLEKAGGLNIYAVNEKHKMKAICDSGKTIYHFHGVSTDSDLRKNIGATLKEISRQLPKEFSDWLRGCFEAGYDVVFVGYGAVDVFDIKPFFESIKDNRYSGRVFYLDYYPNEERAAKALNEDANNMKLDLHKHYEYLLDPFENATICYGKATDFLDALMENEGICCPPFYCTTRKETATQKIEDAFKQLTDGMSDDEKKEYYFLNTFRLCSQLTINPYHIYKEDDNWIESLRIIVQNWIDDGPDTVTNIARANGFTVNSIIGDIYWNNWDDASYAKSGVPELVKPFIDSFNVNGMTELTPYLNLRKGPAPRKLIVEKVHLTDKILKERLEDEKSKIEQQFTVYYLCGDHTKILYRLWRCWLIRPFINHRLKFLLKMVNILLDNPETAFTYRTSYITLCRVRNMIMAMTSSSDDKWYNSKTKCFGDLYHEWSVCMEVPDLADAEKVLKNRIEQYEVRKRRGLLIDDDVKNDLEAIRKELHKWFSI